MEKTRSFYSKRSSAYVCQSCEHSSPQWLGQCPSCGEWNSFVETVVKNTGSSKGFRVGGRASGVILDIKPLSQVVSASPKRIQTGLSEFDRVLGGGFVSGQVILLAGEPGIGKSTLLTVLAKTLSGIKIVYVCGEESMEQIKVRADRMGYKADNLYMVNDTDIDNVCASLSGFSDIGLVIVDSVQTMTSSELMGMAGSVGQVKGCSQKLANLAKSLGVPTIIVGHVTKDGTVAGPKVLEHIVDTVLYLEGDSQHMFRILKTTKNRFGPVSEVGIFEMHDNGMIEVTNPSTLFLNETQNDTSGSCVGVIMEGYRPLLFEVQALTTKTYFGYPKRTTSGFGTNRLAVLIAILEKRCGFNFSTHDVYLNITGGLKVTEHACDLAVCLALVSSLKDVPLGTKVVAFGEVGLGGELRKVSFGDKRNLEAKRLGYTKTISPDNACNLTEAIKLSI